MKGCKGLALGLVCAMVAPVAAARAEGPVVVDFPPAFRAQQLAEMRSHLAALQGITAALARKDYGAASRIARRRLTAAAMSPQERHESRRYMPKRMLAMGMAMHRDAERFALAAQDATVTGDRSSALRALSRVEARCVACHAVFRYRGR